MWNKMKNIMAGIAVLLSWLLTIYWSVTAFGQIPANPTRLNDAAVAPPPTAFTAIWVVTPTGKVLVQPDASIQIDLTATPPVIRAVYPPQPAAPVECVDRIAVPAGGQTSFALTYPPAPGSLARVYKNGLLQFPDADYSLTGQTVLFLPAQGTVPGDYIQILYWRLGTYSLLTKTALLAEGQK